MMPWEQVIKIVDECTEIGVYSILFSWRGESTMYRGNDADGKTRDFGDVLAYARSKRILEVTSLTNGRLLTKELESVIGEESAKEIAKAVVDKLDEEMDA